MQHMFSIVGDTGKQFVVPDLWLTGDHFLGKLSTVGQPTGASQPPIPLGSTNLSTFMDCGGLRPSKRQARATYGHIAAAESP